MRWTLAAAGLLLLAACGGSAPTSLGPAASVGASSIAIRYDVKNECPPSKYAYCVDVYPGPYQPLVDWGCTGSNCAPVYYIRSEFYTVGGVKAVRRFSEYWTPNPYYSGPNSYTVQNVEERRTMLPRNRVEFVDNVQYCKGKAGSGSCGSFTVGVIPQ
jgi:hypothetical protein